MLAGWLSPWGDGAALEKASWYNQEKLSATLRMRVARISVQDDPFVSVGSFETDEGIDGDALHHYVGPGLLEELKEKFQDELGGHEVKVFLVCGGDEIDEQMTKFHYPNRVVVPRGAGDNLIEKPNTGLYVAEPIPGKGAYLAATQVRKALREREMAFLSWAMHPAAVRFLYGGKTGDFEIDADLADFLGTGPAPTGWPTEKLVQRLATAPENRKLVVLVTSGAMSPVTRGHVQMLHAAKERMERAGYVAIGAYLLPTSDEAKGLPELSQAFCDNVAELSVCDDELVAATSLEAVGLGGRPRDEVKPRHLVHALRDELLQRYQLSLEGRNLHAFYVVGEDSEQPNAKLFFSSPEVGVVTVPIESDDSSDMLEQACKHIYLADEVLANGSAALRTLIRAGDTERAAAAMTTAAARFVLSPTSSELERFRADFKELGVRPAQDRQTQTADARSQVLVFCHCRWQYCPSPYDVYDLWASNRNR